MRVAITGVAGFIGGHLAERLLQGGHTVVGLDSFHDNYDPAIKRATAAGLGRHGAFRLVIGDIRDDEALSRLLEDPPEVLVHLAARVGVRTSLEQAAETMDVNVRGTTCVLEACRLAGVRRLVLASSSSVYGRGAATPFQERGPLGDPLSPYAASKRAMELVATAYHHLWSMSFALLRFFTVYGPRQRPDLAIHKFARRILAGEPIPVFGDGSSRRDYTHIDDITQGIAGAIDWTAGAPRLGTFNLASGRTITLTEMISALEAAAGRPALLDRLPPQPGDMEETWGDVALARAELGLPNAVDFQAGVAEFLAWLSGAAPTHAEAQGGDAAGAASPQAATP